MNGPGLLTPTDSARVVADVYGFSLVATAPVLAAVIALVLLRSASAGARVIMWRCAVASLIAIAAGQLVPWEWKAWVLPEPLAQPLITLGTSEMGSDAVFGPRFLLLVYACGVAVVLVRTIIARARLAAVRRFATPLTAFRWTSLLREAGDAVGVPTRHVTLRLSRRVTVPMTWGTWHPVILLPRQAKQWPASRLQAVLRHELSHIGAHDSASRLLARIACAFLWFHPGAWWIARRLEADMEESCDDRVLLSGIRPSDYAEWLALSPAPGMQAVPAFNGSGTLRSRLAAVTDTRRHIVLPGSKAMLVAAAATTAMVTPLATARVAPTRGVLTSLMQETRWESRAWAVVRLAQRPDSVEVARSAARHDPDPSVRAWARYALARVPVTPVARPGS